MIAVTGAGGQLGTAFRGVLPDATFLTRADLDLSRPDLIPDVLDTIAPTVLINCAAYTAVDRAETDAETARTVNADAPAAMAEWCARAGARFVTYSTDYVFDGRASGAYTEHSEPSPRSVYGVTKLEGERRVTAALADALIIRTSWVISGTHPNFVATILRAVRERELRVVDDQHGCPTIADDLALATRAAIEASAWGVLHRANEGPTTWYELARTAVSLAGADPARISPCTTDEFPRPAPRPANSVLASDRAASFGLEPLAPWRASLPAVVANILGWL